MMSLFGRKKPAPAPKAADTIRNLDSNIELLEKKIDHLSERIDQERLVAKQHASRNKRKALTALKRKKLYETQLNQISNTIFTLQTQRIALENVQTNHEALKAMMQVKDTMKHLNQNMTIDDVDDVMDEVRDQMDIANDIGEAMGTPMGDVFDEDELEDELRLLEEEDIDVQLSGLDSLPSAPSQLPDVGVPASAVGAPAGGMTEEDELAALEAEMAI